METGKELREAENNGVYDIQAYGQWGADIWEEEAQIGG